MNTMNWSTTMPFLQMSSNGTASTVVPQWMMNFVEFRKRIFLHTIEPVIVQLLGPHVINDDIDETISLAANNKLDFSDWSVLSEHVDETHRRLGYMPQYVEDVSAFKETSMSFATLMMLFVIMSCIGLIFLSCFYHNQKTSPLFISPRRHRLPKLVPPPLPIDGYFDWVRVLESIKRKMQLYAAFSHASFILSL
jgi:hypothetical protein